MFTINGTGTRYNGYKMTSKPGQATATLWFTFLFIPLIPLSRHIIQPLARQGTSFTFHILAKEKLVLSEVLQTYFYGWILMPLLILWPLPFAVREVQVALHVPEKLQWIPMAFSIIWLIVSVWKLKDWDELRPFKCAQVTLKSINTPQKS